MDGRTMPVQGSGSSPGGHRTGLCKPEAWEGVWTRSNGSPGSGEFLGLSGCFIRAECELRLSLTLWKAQSRALCQMCLASVPSSPRGGCAAPRACSAQDGACAALEGLQSMPAHRELCSVPWSDHHLPAARL